MFGEGSSRRLVALLTGMLLSVLVSATQTLPYAPSTLLVPVEPGIPFQRKAAGDVAYILTPTGDSVKLLSLNLSTTFHASNLGLQTLSAGVPFADASTGTGTFTPSILANGSILVYAGDCSSSTGTAVWTYDPSGLTSAKDVSWVRHGVTAAGEEVGAQGPSLLGAALTFSSQLAPTTSPAMVYVYGGMCPWTNQTASTWQDAASYSNQIRRLAHTAPSDSYSLGALASRGPPIAEAGFTFTSLTPSISNRSGIVTQQVNSVLLGGHTQQAFINMSTAAVWSLPEESWSFVPISPPETTNTELAVKKDVTGRALPTSVSSRSGHTAVLNEDGSAIVVLGGWVGDVTQAADPQLAVLEMGAGYGQWQWSIPTVQPTGQGLYGHGAALLPGNVMMVYGGYSILTSADRLLRRQAGGDETSAMFLNLTSLTWSNAYSNPSYSGQPANPGTSAESDNVSVGVGVGLGVGIPLGLAVVLFAIWYRRRQKAQQQRRDEAVRALAQDRGQFILNDDGDEMVERNDTRFPFGWGPGAARDWYTGGHDPYGSVSRSLGYESLRGTRSGPAVYVPPKTTGNAQRNPTRQVARGLYQPTTLADYESRSGQRGTGGIHPIYEADEDGDGGNAGDSSRSISPDKDEESASNPFLTPTAATAAAAAFNFPGSHTPSPEGPRQDPEVQDWVSDVDAADALLSARSGPTRYMGAGMGRASPTRRLSTRSKGSSPTSASFNGTADDEGRTASGLSDRSAFSFVAARSDSMRLRTGRATTTATTTGKTLVADPDARLGSSDGSSYNTARSSFPALRAEGPGLLLRGKSWGEKQRVESPDEQYHDDDENELQRTPGSPSKSKSRRSWFGSFRRVFSAGTNSPASSRAESPVRRNSSSCEGDYEPRLFGLKALPNATLLRRQRGRGDWEAAGHQGVGSGGAGASGSGQAQGRSSDDWDVEGAGDGRVVQIMFTVPRDRLRVVNGGVEDEEEEVEIVDAGDDHNEDDTESRRAGRRKDVERGELRQAVSEFMELNQPTTPTGLGGRETGKFGGMRDGGRGAEPENWGDELSRLMGDDEDRWDEKDHLEARTSSNKSPVPLDEDGQVAGPSGSSPIMTAEAVRFKRSPTRVLEMVEKIETATGSRKGTPVKGIPGHQVRGGSEPLEE